VEERMRSAIARSVFMKSPFALTLSTIQEGNVASIKQRTGEFKTYTEARQL